MKPEAVLLDLSGTLHINDTPLPGAVDAVERLRAAGVAVLGVSNTSRRTRAELVRLLSAMGFDFCEDEILTAPLATRAWLEARNARPFLLVHENLREAFAGLETAAPNAVVVADAADGFSYAALNEAFRLLMDGAALVATGVNRYFRDDDGALSLDAGPFVRALEFAAGVEAFVTGKPSPAFFDAALGMAGCRTPGSAVMIGDDAVNDVAGAMHAGLRGVLVRTGKYREGDAEAAAGATCVADVGAAIDQLLG